MAYRAFVADNTIPGLGASDLARRAAVHLGDSVTGFGAGDSGLRMRRIERLPFQFFLGRAYADKSVQERLIRSSDRDWTIVRPVVLTNGPRTGRYEALSEPRDWRNGFISRADVADFVVRALDDSTTVGEAPVILHAPLPF